MSQQAELLHKLEQDILIVAGGIRVHRVMGGDPQNVLGADEDRLSHMLKTVLDLKILLGVPSILTIKEQAE